MTREYAIELFNSEIKNFKRLDYSPKEAVQEYIDAMEMAIKALKLIPDNATNGDVIMALFPNLKHTKIITNGVYECHIDHKRHSFDYSWWNAPYKAESEEQV